MLKHQDLVISSKTITAQQIVDEISRAFRGKGRWKHSPSKSRRYSRILGKSGCCLEIARDGSIQAGIALAERRSNTLVVTNIVPLQRSALSITQYNELLKSFRDEIKAHLSGVTTRLSAERATLRDVISGKITYQQFFRYARQFPESNHPLDIERLDTFICYLHRYSRRSFDLDAFEALLQEELQWQRSLAVRVRERVEIGLSVLNVSSNL